MPLDTDRLWELGKLLEAGHLTQSEFDAQKSLLLSWHEEQEHGGVSSTSALSAAAAYQQQDDAVSEAAPEEPLLAAPAASAPPAATTPRRRVASPTQATVIPPSHQSASPSLSPHRPRPVSPGPSTPGRQRSPRSSVPRASSPRPGSPRLGSPRSSLEPPSPPPYPGTVPLEYFPGASAALRKAEGQMHLDVRAAAQACKKQLHRVEVMLPLATATGEECLKAKSAAEYLLSSNKSLSSMPGVSLERWKNAPGGEDEGDADASTTEMKSARSTTGRSASPRRPTMLLSMHREALHHALRHLKESASKGYDAMAERAGALDKCAAALRETIDQLCALTPDAAESRKPNGLFRGVVVQGHGTLSPGTLAPSNLQSALSFSPGGLLTDASSSPQSHHALSIVEGTDSRGEVERLISVAGLFSRAAHNLAMHTREQVIIVRREIQSHREKAAMAQRQMAKTSVGRPDHLSPNGRRRSASPQTRTPPQSAMPAQKASPERSPIVYGQDSVGGSSVYRWPRNQSANRRMSSHRHEPFTDPRLTGKPRPSVAI